jgi:hypothetical protein
MQASAMSAPSQITASTGNRMRNFRKGVMNSEYFMFQLIGEQILFTNKQTHKQAIRQDTKNKSFRCTSNHFIAHFTN